MEKEKQQKQFLIKFIRCHLKEMSKAINYCIERIERLEKLEKTICIEKPEQFK